MSGDWDDEPVGYKQPPRWGQFRKGRSGNPKGRPRKKPDAMPTEASAVDDVVRKEVNRRIRVNDADGSRELPMVEIVVRSRANAAAKGNVIAQREFLRDARELEVRDAARKEAEAAEEQELFDHIVRRKAEQARLWAEAERAGTERAEPWPHPDDILIDPGNRRWRFRGPASARLVPRYEYYRAQRNIRYWEATILWRQGSSGWARVWDLLWVYWDARLPLRWQIASDSEMHRRHMSDLSMRILRAREREAQAQVAFWGALADIPPHDRDPYRIANEVVKPVMQRLGYRSLAQFEHAQEIARGDGSA